MGDSCVLAIAMTLRDQAFEQLFYPLDPSGDHIVVGFDVDLLLKFLLRVILRDARSATTATRDAHDVGCRIKDAAIHQHTRWSTKSDTLVLLQERVCEVYHGSAPK